jgi:hypothetical protein
MHKLLISFFCAVHKREREGKSLEETKTHGCSHCSSAFVSDRGLKKHLRTAHKIFQKGQEQNHQDNQEFYDERDEHTTEDSSADGVVVTESSVDASTISKEQSLAHNNPVGNDTEIKLD